MFKRKRADTDILERRIKSCSIFSELSDSDVKALLRIAHIRDYSAEEKIFAAGTIGLCFYIIVKGSVRIVSEDVITPNEVRAFKDGDYFSEIHLFTESNHTVTCIADEVTRLMIFSKPGFEDLIKINPKLGNKILLKFLDFFGQKLDQMYQENIEIKQRSGN
jgi:CRP-like cAMP-binding protein